MNDSVKDIKKRMKEIINLIGSLAAGDLNARVVLSEQGDDFDAIAAAELHMNIDRVELQIKRDLMEFWMDQLSDHGQAVINNKLADMGNRFKQTRTTVDWVSMAEEVPDYVMSRLMSACERKQKLGSLRPNFSREAREKNTQAIGSENNQSEVLIDMQDPDAIREYLIEGLKKEKDKKDKGGKK